MAHITTILQQDTLPQGEVITWLGYKSRLMSAESVKPRAEIGILPHFQGNAASLSMMKHAMELTIKGTEFCNPGHIGVLEGDQPLYALAKKLQLKFPNSIGEDKLVMMMEALHIEDKAHQMIGKILRD